MKEARNRDMRPSQCLNIYSMSSAPSLAPAGRHMLFATNRSLSIDSAAHAASRNSAPEGGSSQYNHNTFTWMYTRATHVHMCPALVYLTLHGDKTSSITDSMVTRLHQLPTALQTMKNPAIASYGIWYERPIDPLRVLVDVLVGV
jgi:hypothetical protein